MLEYVDSPADAMTAIGAVLRPSATVSVLAANTVAAVLHRALAGRFTEARQLLEGETAVAGSGPPRRFTLPELTALIEAAGLRAGEAHGLRIFSGLVPGALLDADAGGTEALRALETAAAAAPPLRDIAAQLHLLGHRWTPPWSERIQTDHRLPHPARRTWTRSTRPWRSGNAPSSRGLPVIVGGASGRGVVLSATYEARAFGVRSAMPVGRAQRMCPRAVFVPPRHRLYAAVSEEVMAIFGTVTPDVEPLALDEAFLDVSGALRRLGPPAVIARHIRALVAEQQGITCSVGVAPTKFVAKIASARCKPDGMLVVPRAGVLGFLHALPVSALWGVGERTGEALARLGLRTVADIAHAPLATLQHELGVAQGIAPGRPGQRPGRAPGDPAYPGEEHRGRGDLRRRHRRPRNGSGGSCSSCPGGPRTACARADTRPARCRSSSGWPASRR